MPSSALARGKLILKKNNNNGEEEEEEEEDDEEGVERRVENRTLFRLRRIRSSRFGHAEDISMSQGSSLSNDLDGTMCDLEGNQQQQQHPCQCSTMSGINSIRTQRDRTDRSVMGSTRISNNQELPRGLETLQSAFEPLRRLDSPMSHQEARNVEIMEHQNTPLTRHARNVPCSPRNLDLSRNLAFEAARRVQESLSLQESRQSLTSSPSHLSDTNANPMETSLSSKETSEKQLDDPCGLSPKQNISKDKLKNIQQVLNTYQHHRIPISGESNTPERNVHGHFHGDSHVHLHKHNVDNTSRTNANLEASEGLKGFQQRQQHSHHHHGTPKTSSVTHLHGSAMIHHAGGHHHGNLAAGLVGHIHSNPTTSLSGSGNGNPTINHGNTVTGGNNSNSHHHANPIAAGTSTTTMTTTTITMTTTTTMMSAVAGTTTTTSIIGQKGSPLTSHRHPTVSSAMSGTSSNSSMMNHGGSPSVHRHVSVNASASLSATPLVARHHGSSSTGSLTGRSSVNHHHVSSGISCESSSSNANTRTHSRLDHVHDHHHLLQQVHSLHPDSRSRDRAASLVHPLDEQQHHSHHHGHVHVHGHPHLQSNDTKNSSLIRMDAIQVSAPSKSSKCQCHAVQQGNRNKRNSEGETDDSGGIVEVTSRTHQPPALPPRPPPRPTRRYETASADQCHTGEGGCCKKYVVLCCLCGGLSAGVGSVFLAVHAVLSAHTASLALFETVPSYIPGIMLILMGLFTMLLARRKHRYGLLMKVCGSVGVVCALVCVLVTVTTTVIHMSRLQGLRECVYTARARSCTCYGAPQSKGDPGVLFEGTPHCEAVHGALYTCLRALFGVSVAGILACIFSCMLVYQLLSHEKKKMYWEQLELRCRSLYGQGGPVGPPTASCGCCNDCGGASPWWAQTPGNLYTPNPDLAPSRRWRLPWSRPRGPAPSPDSNYGFHTQTRQTETNPDNTAGPYSVLNSQSSGPYSVLNTPNGPYTPSTASYSVLETPVPLWGPPPPYSDPNSPARRPQVADTRPRMSKRIDNFDGNEDHRSRSTKRPSDNYENAEEISNSTDPEGGNDGTMKGRRARKPLKGVENGAFQQEPNPGGKQSESELYFGDVSSCCGPESSFYDLAVEKEGAEHSEGVDYLAARLGKRQLSKRSRLPLPLPSDGGDIPSDSYANSDEPRNTRGPFLAPDAQYEVIQQARYSYYAPKEDEELDEEAATSSYFREEDTDRPRERDYRDYHSGQEEETPQCCLSDSTTLDSGWQSGEQQQSDDNVRPVNV